MLILSSSLLLYICSALVFSAHGQSSCQDFSADPTNCTRFIRCFHNLRVRFSCPPGTAWENTLKTCVLKDFVESCDTTQQTQQRSLDSFDDSDIYDADPSALNGMIIGRTLADSKSLGPIVTPRQYQCSYCSTGSCAVVVNAIQCYCGQIQCPPATAAPQPRNPCSPNPCLNGGQCISQGAGFICQCPSTFTGNRCEAPAANPCNPNPCLNGGTCIPQGSNFFCQCPTNFVGICCETRLTTTTPYNPCNPNPCLNGGTCIAQGSNFFCQCPTNFVGICCETRLTTTTPYNPCSPNPCLNGGTCIPQGSNFLCQCPTNFIGVCCETRLTTTTPFNPCLQNPCQNGAQCIPTGSSFLCQCPQGFYGSRCELRNYCTPNPCSNNGLCTQTPTGYICSCTYPWTGTNCQQMITTTTTTPATRAPCGVNCGCVVGCPTAVVANPCLPNPCQNMGGCAVQSQAAFCYCPNLYYGYYCQFRQVARSLMAKGCNRTCLNGGQCYVDEQGQSRCSCSNEFYGDRCELKNRPNSCQPKNPCMNNGRCVSTNAGAECVCQRGTSGVLCERILKSDDSQYCPLKCQAGGTCVYVQSQAECRCPANRSGRLCEKSFARSLTTDFDE